MYRYYCIMRPPMIGGLPCVKNIQNVTGFDERRYISEIDRMAWGWVEYDRELSYEEIHAYELIAHPRD